MMRTSDKQGLAIINSGVAMRAEHLQAGHDEEQGMLTSDPIYQLY